MKQQIGFPDYLLNDTEVNNEYQQVRNLFFSQSQKSEKMKPFIWSAQITVKGKNSIQLEKIFASHPSVW